MKERLKHFLSSWREVPAAFPAETGLSVLFILCTIIDFETESPMAGRILHHAPILFFLTFSLHAWQKHDVAKRWKRMVYLLSALPFIPIGLYAAETAWMSFSTTYLVTLFILLLLSIVNTLPGNNRRFMQRTCGLAGSALSAIVLAGIAYLLVISIHEAADLLFDLEDFFSREASNRINTYAAGFVFGGLMIGLFLMFNRKEEQSSGRDKVMEVLFRFILMPALLIYTVIFYLYIARIVIGWSLPEGGICYMATAFIFSSYLLKGIKLLQEHRYYDRYFRYISWINLPTLLLYWFSAFYRINEYGWTEMRVYLVVFGLIMTCLVLLFLRDREHQYVQSAWVAVLLLGLVTYVPGISAKDIEKASQTARGEYPAKAVKQERININLFEHSEAWDIDGYRSFLILFPDHHNHSGDNLIFRKGDSAVFTLSKADYLQHQLETNGLDLKDPIPEKAYPSFLKWETDSTLVIFEHIGLNRVSDEKPFDIEFYGNAYYFKK